MKKALFLILVCTGSVFIFGCKTTSPVFYSFSEATPYTILGEVSYSSTEDILSQNKGAGYANLLLAARARYPDCDYVIDVMVDKRETNYLIVRSIVYTMRGMAIKYNPRPAAGASTWW